MKPEHQSESIRVFFTQRGFTLIELIMTLIIIGVLAAFAAPRLLNNDDFYARGFHDETMALLRYAQKTAVAQRRTVCVTFSAAAPAYATLAIASAPATSTCGLPLIGPNKNTKQSGIDWYCQDDKLINTPVGSGGCIFAKPNISYSESTPTFSFNGLGQPSGSQTFQISTSSGAVGNPVIVEAETGYVHD